MDIELVKQTTDLAVQAQGLKVIDQRTATRATELILAGKGMIKKIKDFFAPLKRAQDEAKQKLISAERSELIKVEPVVEFLSSSLSSWRSEQERIRREAEEKARRQEEERRRLEERAMREAQEAEQRAEAEKRRIAEEAITEELRAKTEAVIVKLREEAALKKVEADRKAKEEQDRILNAAAAEESKFEPVTIVPEKAANNGLALRDNWCFQIVDPAAIPREFLLIDEVKIGKVVRAASGKISIPGVRIFNQPSMMKTR